MNKFAWINMMPINPLGGGARKSLIEFVSENEVRFHGTVFHDGSSVRILARGKDRELKTVEEPVPSVKEGMLAVEKFLFDDGVLEEGFVIEYESEEE